MEKTQFDLINKMSLKARFFLVYFLVALVSGYFFYFRHQSDVEKTMTSLIASEKQSVRSAASILTTELVLAKSDLQSLVNLPVFKNLTQDPHKTQDQNSRKKVVVAFQDFLNRKKEYAQIRYLDHQGREVIRVDYRNSQAQEVPMADLQKEPDQLFLLASAKLAQEEIFISTIELDTEDGKIKSPPEPIVRIGYNIHSLSGQRNGILFLTCFAQRISHQFMTDESLENKSRLLLINSDGYYLHHPNEEIEYGQIFNRENKIEAEYSAETWRQIQSQKSGSFVAPEGIWTFHGLTNREHFPELQGLDLKVVLLLENKLIEQIRLSSFQLEITFFLLWLFFIGVIFGLFFAFAERKAQEQEEQKQIRENVQNLSRLASLGTLAAGISHEINNPLAIMKTMGMIIKDKANGDCAELKEFFDKHDQALDRVTAVVRSLKNLSGPRTYVKTPFEIGLAIDEVVNLIQMQVRLKNIDLKLDIRDGETEVMGELLKLEEVLIAMITNALDAIEELGEYSQRGLISISGYQEGGQYQIRIEDNGAGIRRADLPFLFDPFFTTKPTGRGAGMGLAVAHAYVRQMGGQISVVSEWRKGTVFTIQLPIYTSHSGRGGHAS
ncbi:MAG: hypothetical protein BroJett040_20540 [Oligoflexia bacterium]|nr:MAG: hypothetical protein BroJett040_20540 [Oligoflexia bacterium]